jgi:hypothetical protein
VGSFDKSKKFVFPDVEVTPEGVAFARAALRSDETPSG